MTDLTIEYRKIGQLSTCLGNERVRIDLDGNAFYSRNNVECEGGELWSAPLCPVGRLATESKARLKLELKASGILDMPRLTIDEIAEGGVREELSIKLEGEERCFIIQNKDSLAFKRAVRAIFACCMSLKPFGLMVN